MQVSTRTGGRKHWLFCCGFKRGNKPAAQGGRNKNDAASKYAVATAAPGAVQMTATAASGAHPQRTSLDALGRQAAQPHSVVHVGGALPEGMGEDVEEERQRVLDMGGSYAGHPIVCCEIEKTYPSQDGAPAKVAVRGLTLAVEEGECFGLLGPNGAGKSTAISIMTGFTEPSGGTAIITGRDIRDNMRDIYSSMGVCPQHDLLWDNLTGREHLAFYGRLKVFFQALMRERMQNQRTGRPSCITFSSPLPRSLCRIHTGPAPPAAAGRH